MADATVTPIKRRKAAGPDMSKGEVITAPGLWASSWKLLQYNPSDLLAKRGQATFEAMLLDDQIVAAVSFKRDAVLSTGWKIESPQDFGDDWPPTEFVRRRLAAVEDGIEQAFRGMLSALPYGHSITEKTYEIIETGEDAGLIGIKSLKAKATHYLRYELDEFGNIVGIRNDQDTLAFIDPAKCILWAHGDNSFGNPYGKSELEACYRAYVLCNNSYRWLGLYLEKLGVPPWIVLYNPESLPDDQQRLDMQTLFRDIQSAASGAIPRANKDDIEIWTPQNAGGVNTVFIPALEHLKKDIARALLMPGQMGITPDQESGSYARARVALDMFLLSLTSVQQRMQHKIQTQLINQLVALNFDTGGVFPRFNFLPITAEDQAKICATWAALVDRDIVTSDTDDENHIRSMVGFPKRETEDKNQDGEMDATERPRVPLRYLPALAPALTRDEVRAALNLEPLPAGEGGDKLMNEPAVEPPPPVIVAPPAPGQPGATGQPEPGGQSAAPHDAGDTPPKPEAGSDNKPTLHEAKAPDHPFPDPEIEVEDFEIVEVPEPPKPDDPGLTEPERRADFAAILTTLDTLDETTTQAVAASLRTSLYAQIDAWLLKPPPLSRAATVKADVPEQVGTLFNRGLNQSLSSGRKHANAEVGDAQAHAILPNFDPVAAISYLKSKVAFFVSGLTGRITDTIRGELLFGLRNGLPFTETRNRLLDALTPWVGAPDADPKALSPERLLTTVRTNTTDSYNQGRLVEARRLGAKGLVTGMQHSSVLDSRTTPICRSLHGKCYRIDDPQLDRFTPPLHYNCRSVLLPITIGVDVSDDPADELHWITPEEVAEGKRLMPGEFGGSYTATKKNAPGKGADG